VAFDGVSKFLDLTGFAPAANDYTVVAVFKQAGISGAASYALIGANSPDSIWSVRAPLTLVGINDGADRVNGAAVNGEQSLEWQLNKAANTADYYRNGAAIGSAAYVNALTWATSKIGRRADAASWYLNGTITELIVANRILTAAELAQLRFYISLRYLL
jgi:hypothetical protein